MSHEQHYVVLAGDLEAELHALNERRAKLDEEMARVKGLLSFVRARLTEDREGDVTKDAARDLPEGGGDEYRGKSIVKATEAFLQRMNRFCSTSEIAKEILGKGVKSDAKNPTNTIYGALFQHSKTKRARIVRKAGGYWGLREWKKSAEFGEDDERTADGESFGMGGGS